MLKNRDGEQEICQSKQKSRGPTIRMKEMKLETRETQVLSTSDFWDSRDDYVEHTQRLAAKNSSSPDWKWKVKCSCS